MIKIRILPVLIFAFSLCSLGQEYSREFGKVVKDDVELTEYPADKNAEAVVLFDMAKSYFVDSNNGFDLVFERTSRIKILTEAGIKWAEIEIPYYQEGNIYERIFDLEAYSYNYENGQINKTKLDVSNSYTEKINHYWNLKKFALPNVKAGTIIEYRYKINSQYLFNLRDWEFQRRIPVVYSEYEVRMIPFYGYTFLLQGANKFSSTMSYVDKGLSRQFGSTNYNDYINKYIMKDLPAFNSEEFITSINDYIIKIDFQLSKITQPNGSKIDVMTSWDLMIKDLLNHASFGKYIAKAEKLLPSVIDSKELESKTTQEKFDIIINYVKANYNWDKMDGKYASKLPNKLITEKVGNCADINLFTIGLLNGAGIEAYPLLISTRENGKIKYDYPFSHFFDYVLILAIIDGQNVLSDGTEILSLNNRIPSRCINERGLIVKKDEVKWVGLECLLPSEINTEIAMEITKEMDLRSAITKTSTEYEALYCRNNYSDDVESIKKKLDSKDFTIIDSTISVQNQHDKNKPYVLSYTTLSQTSIINDKIYLSPFLGESLSENPLKQPTRTYPIDMVYPTKRSFKTSINIPEGYQVYFIPEEFKISNQSFDFNYSVKNEQTQLVVSFDYYFKKSVYPDTDYSKIKYYFKEIVKKGNEKIVLSKKI